jgi:hypothetical protein
MRWLFAHSILFSKVILDQNFFGFGRKFAEIISILYRFVTLRWLLPYWLGGDYRGQMFDEVHVSSKQWWAKLLRLLTVNSLSYFVKIKY